MDHLIGKHRVTYQIAETVHRVDVVRLKVGQDGIERTQIAVDVTEDGDVRGVRARYTDRAQHRDDRQTCARACFLKRPALA